jgi:hypothetical protein
MSRVMPCEMWKALINRGKVLFFLGIIRKGPQLRNEAFPTLSFGCVSEIPRNTEWQLARPQQEAIVLESGRSLIMPSVITLEGL